MSVLPKTRIKRLEFFEARYDLWIANATALGISSASANSLKTKTNDDRDAFNAAQIARDAAKSATLNWYIANDDTVTLGRDLIRTIKNYAESTNNPTVYTLAAIDPPAPPTPVPAPTTPTDMNGSVSPSGVVTITWRAERSGPTSGIFFMVERQRASGPWAVIGAAVEKSFIDPEANITESAVAYRVRAMRGETTSDYTTPVVFNFVPGGGFVMSTAPSTETMKMAA